MSDTSREPDDSYVWTSGDPSSESTAGRLGDPDPMASDRAAAPDPAGAPDPASARDRGWATDPAAAPDPGRATDPAAAPDPGRATDPATASDPASAPGSGSPRPAGGAGAAPGGPAKGLRGRIGGARRAFGLAPATGDGVGDERLRRRRRWFVAAISVGAAIIVLALCAGALSVISSTGEVRDRVTDAHESRRLRDLDCLELERRLNRLTPPGATTGPGARATAARDENAAVRIYLDTLDDQGAQDGWRQLLDARTVYADALDRQAKSRTPAFFVAPRTADGRILADWLGDVSPAPCAGPVRRLATPDL
ncbi:MAG: hypothetical protein ABW046_12775 [Actinoplanes sp.]